MSTPESIARAFGQGLMEGMIGRGALPEAQAPMVIPVEAIQNTVKAAVHEMLDPLLEETPSADQLDLFHHDIEHAPSDPIAEMTYQKIAEANARAAAREEAQGREPERPVNYSPNSPTSGNPWMSPL